jgi:hypothetical protein
MLRQKSRIKKRKDAVRSGLVTAHISMEALLMAREQVDAQVAQRQKQLDSERTRNHVLQTRCVLLEATLKRPYSVVSGTQLQERPQGSG